MLKHDGAVPSLPCWTAHGFFSLNTRPGLAVPRRNRPISDSWRLKPLDAMHALKPLRKRSPILCQDRLLIPSYEMRTGVFDEKLSNCNDESKFEKLHLFERQLKRRRRELKVWEEDESVHIDDLTDQRSGEDYNPLAKLNERLPTLQRKSWVSFPGSSSPPIPFSTVRDAISADDLREEFHVSHSASRKKPQLRRRIEEYRRGNHLAHCKVRDENVFVLSRSCRLDSVIAYTLSPDESFQSTAMHLKTYAACERIPDVIMCENEKIFDLKVMPHADDDENIRLLAATSNSIALARISSQGTLKWEDHLSILNVRSSALNPLCPDEFCVLSSGGLFCGTADGFRAARKLPDTDHRNFHDVQYLVTEAQFRQVEYGTHPRTVLLASRKEVAQFDLRTKGREDHLTILDLQGNTETRSRHLEVGTFCFAPNSDDFRLLVATRASVAYYDIRRPEVPLLDWSLVLPSAPDKICATRLNSDAMRSDVVVLGSPGSGKTDLYHALHCGDLAGFSPFHETQELDEYSLPKQELAWSDMPIEMTTIRPYQDYISGCAVMSECGNRHATVLQWSTITGLTVHPVGVTSSLDEDDYVGASFSRQSSDNTINMKNSMSVMVSSSQEKCRCDRYPVSRSVPGSFLHSRVKCLLLKDAKDLRKRLCSTENDDRDSNGSSRVSRPFMKDLIFEVRGGIASEPSSSGSESTGERSSDSPENVEDNADRETIIREVAILKSQESEDSDHPENDCTDFISAIGTGCFFDELARSVRSGFGHHPMPISVSALKEAISDSPLTNSYETAWHEQCEYEHSGSPSTVATTGNLPSWLCTKVYYTEEAEKGQSLRSSSMPENSLYGALLRRMQSEFFD